MLSYVCANPFSVFAGNGMFSSMTCPSLSSSTILQVPHTHILFSLRSSAPKITSQALRTADGHPFSLITLAPFSVSAFEAFRQHTDELYHTLKALQRGVHSGMVGDPSQIATTALVEAPEVDSKDE